MPLDVADVKRSKMAQVLAIRLLSGLPLVKLEKTGTIHLHFPIQAIVEPVRCGSPGPQRPAVRVRVRSSVRGAAGSLDTRPFTWVWVL